MANIVKATSPDGRSVWVDTDTGQIVAPPGTLPAGYPGTTSSSAGPRTVKPPTNENLGLVQGAKSAEKVQRTQDDLWNEILNPAYQRQLTETGIANLTDANALSGFSAAQDRARGGYQNVATNVRNDNNAYNAQAQSIYDQLGSTYAGLNQQDQAGLSRYMSETDPLMTMLRAQGSDPADVQRQLQSYNQLSGIGSGSLDYQAAISQAVLAPPAERAAAVLAIAERYNSNPQDVARQMEMYSTLKGIGGGSLDYKVNEKDLGEQTAVLEKYKGLSDPEVTAKERFLSELARREFESSDRSSREAVSANLAARGLRSGGQEIAMQQAAHQQLAQDRLLKELGIQAQAVDRSMEALGGWGNQANVIRGMNDTVGLANQGTRLSGFLGATDQSNQIRGANDRVGMFNTAEQNQTNRLNASNETNVNMFNAGEANTTNRFNAGMQTQNNQFNAGQINNASANNQATRLSGSQSAAMQSNSIRTANDAMRNFQDSFASLEASRAGELAGSRADFGLRTTNQKSQRAQDLGMQGNTLVQNNSARSQTSNDVDWDAVGKTYGMDQDWLTAATGAGQNRLGRAVTNTNTASNITGVRSGQVTLADQVMNERLLLQLSGLSKDSAIARTNY